jgi:hypothetical protein
MSRPQQAFEPHAAAAPLDLCDSRTASRICYSIPESLWDALTEHVERADRGRLETNFEVALTRRVDAIDTAVGLRNNFPIQDPYLRSPDDAKTIRLAEQMAAMAAGLTPPQLFPVPSWTMLRQLAKIRLGGAAYLGWLWTNRIFLDELAELHGAVPSLLRADALPPLPLPPPSGTIDGNHPLLTQDSRPDPTASHVRDFCTRWRLAQIVGPQTVYPLGPQLASPLPQLDAARTKTSGAVLYIPDIAPLPDREELRAMAEENVRATASGQTHLSKWIEIVSAGSGKQQEIGSYAKIYVIQHYMRVLFSRHAERLHQSSNALQTAFATWLNVNVRTIRRAFAVISDRLGSGWMTRPSS